MSVKAVSAAFEEGDRLNLAPVDRLILLRLGDWADDFGYCFPGVLDLVAKVGVDERTIRRHMTELEAAELVLRLVPGGGKGRSTLYRMLPLVLPDVPNPPGVARYEARYGLTVNPDILSPLPDTGTNGGPKGDILTNKRGHSSVHLSVNDPSLHPFRAGYGLGLEGAMKYASTVKDHNHDVGWPMLFVIFLIILIVLALDARLDDLEYQVCVLTQPPPTACLP